MYSSAHLGTSRFLRKFTRQTYYHLSIWLWSKIVSEYFQSGHKNIQQREKSGSSIAKTKIFQQGDIITCLLSRTPTSSIESVSYQHTDAICRTGRRRRLLRGHGRRVCWNKLWSTGEVEVSRADVLWTRHAIFLPHVCGRGRLRDEPREHLRSRDYKFNPTNQCIKFKPTN